MGVNILWWVSISKAFYKVAVELCQAVQLCVFILGMRYLNLGVLKRVFGYGCAVCTLVIRVRELRLRFCFVFQLRDILEQIEYFQNKEGKREGMNLCSNLHKGIPVRNLFFMNQ